MKPSMLPMALGAAMLFASSAFASDVIELKLRSDASDGLDPGPTEQALSALIDHSVVLLHWSIRLSEDHPIHLGEGDNTGRSLRDCSFGPVSGIDVISPPVQSTHLLVDIRMGTPDLHAANQAFCEYSPNEDGFANALRLRGCFLAHKYSIPTAVGLYLNPLPAQACALTK